MGPTPFYGARAEKPPQKADFAMKQTNICRLSGDIKNIKISAHLPKLAYTNWHAFMATSVYNFLNSVLNSSTVLWCCLLFYSFNHDTLGQFLYL